MRRNGAKRYNARCPIEFDILHRQSKGLCLFVRKRSLKGRKRNKPCKDRRDCHIDYCADNKGSYYSDRQIPFWITRLFGGRRYRVKPDIREEYDGGARLDPRKPIGRERGPILRFNIEGAYQYKKQQHNQFYGDYQFIESGTFLYASDKQCCNKYYDKTGRNITDDGYPQNAGRFVYRLPRVLEPWIYLFERYAVIQKRGCFFETFNC